MSNREEERGRGSEIGALRPEIDWDGPAAQPTIGRMPGYEPVDLSAACNAGVDALGGEPGDVPLGRVDLRGLPFLIGPEPPSPQRCFLLPGVPTPVGIAGLRGG